MNPAHDTGRPSDWVVRWSVLIPEAGAVLDVAAGRGRHAFWLVQRGHPVDAVDRDPESVAALCGMPGVTGLCADIEGGPWPYAGRRFAGVIVTNYLHRPLLATLVDSVAPGGVLIYETFAAGNERFGRPSNPAFLLQPGELIAAVQPRLRIVAYEDLVVEQPRPAVVQRICAVKSGA